MRDHCLIQLLQIIVAFRAPKICLSIFALVLMMFSKYVHKVSQLFMRNEVKKQQANVPANYGGWVNFKISTTFHFFY